MKRTSTELSIDERIKCAKAKSEQAHAQNPAVICTDCEKPSPAGLFYVGEQRLCGDCAYKHA